MLLFFSASVFSTEVGQLVPDCPVMTSMTSQPVKLSDYQGKVLLIDFWATWCPPCEQSMPFLNRLRNEFKDKDFEIVAINVDDDTEETKRFLDTHVVDYPILLDPKAQCPPLFKVKAMPSSYFVDRTGKIRAIHLGYRESDQVEIRKHVLELLGE